MTSASQLWYSLDVSGKFCSAWKTVGLGTSESRSVERDLDIVDIVLQVLSTSFGQHVISSIVDWLVCKNLLRHWRKKKFIVNCQWIIWSFIAVSCVTVQCHSEKMQYRHFNTELEFCPQFGQFGRCVQEISGFIIRTVADNLGPIGNVACQCLLCKNTDSPCFQ